MSLKVVWLLSALLFLWLMMISIMDIGIVDYIEEYKFEALFLGFFFVSLIAQVLI